MKEEMTAIPVQETIIRKSNFINRSMIRFSVARLRKRRFLFFKELLSAIPRPVTILDVGGSPWFWESMGFHKENDIRLTLVNLMRLETDQPNFNSIVQDARDMRQFKDKEFDIVFCNSLFEHIVDADDRALISNEIRRVAKRYFIQTPNRYFPIEPHSFMPFFQFFPLRLKIWLLAHLDMGWYKKLKDKDKAREVADSVRLLDRKEIKGLFPEASVYEEKFLWLTKSFVMYYGWDTPVD
jgi:SAM-dependent methyltransferase